MKPELSRRVAQLNDTPYFQYLKRLGAWPIINQLTEEADGAEGEEDFSDDMKTLIKAADRSVEIAAKTRNDDYMDIAQQVNAEMGEPVDADLSEEEEEDFEEAGEEEGEEE